MQLLPLALLAAAVFMLSSSCGNDKKDTIAISADPETFPTMKTLNVSTLISDSGYTRYHITTPVWLMFEEAKEPHWTFPEGIFLVQFDNSMADAATFRADTAKYLSERKIWQFDNNVRMRNINGDRFLTQQLFWNQNERKIYSDSFIHIERADRILEGYGFVSNENMTTYTIRHPSGIFPTADFVSDDKTQAAAPADTARTDTTTARQPRRTPKAQAKRLSKHKPSEPTK